MSRTRAFRYEEQANGQKSRHNVKAGKWDAVAALVKVLLRIVVDQRANYGSKVDIVSEESN